MSDNREFSADSIVTVTPLMGELIRYARLRPELENLNSETRVTILDVNNSFIRYVKYYMPSLVNDCFEPTQGIYRCCPLLRRICSENFFDPKDIRFKWTTIVNNIQTLNGEVYDPTTSRYNFPNGQRPRLRRDPRRVLQIATIAPEPSEQLEPTELNQARADRRETVARSRLNRLFHSNTHDLELSLFSSGVNDECVNNENDATPPQPATITTSTENCLICFDAPRTHAFLHFGLSETDSSMHYVACARCADKCKWATKGCPICRQPVVSVIKIV